MTEHKHEKEEHKKTSETHEHKHEHHTAEHAHQHSHEEKHEHKTEHVHHVEHKDVAKEIKEQKAEIKEQPRKKGGEAIANGLSLHMSKRHGMYICKFIKNKSIDNAMKDLEDVMLFKRAVPFKGEIPHRKGKMMSGRYPINAADIFIKILKGLRGNALSRGLDLEKTKISFASSNWASRPSRSDGRHGKRTHIVLKAMEMEK